MPVEYINSAGSTSVTLDDCQATTGWTLLSGTSTGGFGGHTFAATADYPPRESTLMLEWGGDTGGPRGAYTDLGVGNEIDLDDDDLGAWFLAFEEFDGTTYLTLDGTDPDAVVFRASSDAGFTTNYLEWNLAGDGGINRVQPTWNRFLVSGNTADTTVGTPNRNSIRSIGIITNQVGDNNAGFFTSAPPHGMDWYTFGSIIRVTGTDGGSPWTFARIFEVLEEQLPFHGLVEKQENLYVINAGLQFGDGSATLTEFEDDSAFVFIRQTSSQVKHDIRVKGNTNFTLGKKTVGADRNYATGGVRIITEPFGDHSSDFIIEDEGATTPIDCNLYGVKLEGWNNVEFGDGADADPDVEIIKLDCFNNGLVTFRSSDLVGDDIRIHSSDGSERDQARILVAPTSLKNLRCFQALDALDIRVTATIEELFVGDYTSLSALTGVTATLLNTRRFDANKLRESS